MRQRGSSSTTSTRSPAGRSSTLRSCISPATSGLLMASAGRRVCALSPFVSLSRSIRSGNRFPFEPEHLRSERGALPARGGRPDRRLLIGPGFPQLLSWPSAPLPARPCPCLDHADEGRERVVEKHLGAKEGSRVRFLPVPKPGRRGVPEGATWGRHVGGDVICEGRRTTRGDRIWYGETPRAFRKSNAIRWA